MRRRVGANRRDQAVDSDLDRALDAMSEPELRSFIRSVLDDLEDEQRAAIVDALVARATRGEAGWRPSAPSRRVVDEVGTRAFLAGDHATARAVFDALLPPIANGEVDLGHHEMVDEVLSVDVHATVAQYVTSVYMTTPLNDRADAVYDAIGRVGSICCYAAGRPGKCHPSIEPRMCYCIHYRIPSMPVRLNITIDEDVHERLKRELPAKGISRFINDAIRTRLRPSREVLDRAYRTAARERWRKTEARDWEVTDVEDWPA